MDNQTSLPLNLNYFYQQKSMDELIRQQSLLQTMELEEIKIKAQEELKIKDQQISQLKHLLKTAINERDEAQNNCRKILLQNLIIQQQNPTISSIEDDPNNGFSSSNSDETIVSSPENKCLLDLPVAVETPLPEKGKLLEAVVKAGPLLQTLLIAGPMPQWRHPPPPLETYQIPAPPVAIDNCSRVNRKRGMCEGTSVELKYQRVVLQ